MILLQEKSDFVIERVRVERFHPNCGRVAVKLVSEAYHLRKEEDAA